MKVFGIGLPRTGTTSLSHVLNTLGFKAWHGWHAVEVPDHVEAGSDTPFWYVFPKLVKQYPGARFIYPTRPAQEWVDSFCNKGLIEAHQRMVRRSKRLFVRKRRHRVDIHCYLEFFGTATLIPETLVQKHGEHADWVRATFADQPDRLLEIPLSEINWEVICRFLDLEAPKVPFPRVNQSKSTQGPD
ncbi:MAG: sulfotransferase family protein [Pseudomonadota bacterium]